MRKLSNLHEIKIREIKRRYELPEDTSNVCIEDNTMHPYIEVETIKMFLPLRKTSLHSTKKGDNEGAG